MNDIGKLVKALSFIEEFVETTTTLATERNVQSLLSKVLASARNFTNCEAGRVYVLDVTKTKLQLRISQWEGGEPQNDWYRIRDFGQMGSSAANDPLMFCGMTSSVVLIDDVYRYTGFDLEYIYQHDQVNGTRTQSLILVPLRDHDKQTIGVLELVNAKDAYNRRYVSFKSLEPIICAFAAQAAVCINNALLIETNSHLIELLNDTNQRLEKENRFLKARNSRNPDYNIIGQSEAMQRVFRLMEKAMDTAVSILLTGETGTGKEVFARAIHENSVRKHKPFVTQNCAALPEQLLESELFGYKKGAFTGATSEKKGLFELANGGSIFLDEIGDMPLNLQSKILRVLQEGEVRPLGATGSVKVDVRVVAATHCNLPEKIKSGEFREDLFFRLNVFPIVLPALRDRDADIKLLLDHFVKKYTRLYGKRIAGISPTALDLLLNYPFPGNVRELQNAIERAVLLCEDGGSLLIEHLPESIQDCTQGRVVVGRRSGETLIHQSRAMQDFSSLKKAVNAYEISVIEQHLQANNWNQTRTAETLQIPRRTLIDKMSRYNIKTPDRKKRRSL
ncbi:MAG: sigma-54-dependent Fis family transcriptional regulator [Pseudomonadales bacterium]|uniref:sigma-54-dependent Fis family transcriptional regulator n=1 Tax=unclassified Ketobacter TaxID=2639109 RepID=UPI000C523431|nr:MULTISPECIES: sigma-54 dependent transcriptional regulator [unclassified Ketobacter]MAA59387.1 sigma-54-dependent Fis family transcriptional regulator [Pseudomonadales bacterium]MEC8810284.1 sigma-54 dependent transcriptional regulator [Pseudomonadota bacterium]HAG95511.1 sigma-54-dependent Fis family transcriptional regulator [Gammaproteobacteria bacterium]MAQ23764.1 sigma-54-dependent Fis family transcriptional regulator [Pseudomonadales bacterium]MBI26251.1 sigma-54-dependent Fis family |tara:strand:- start:14545 stop:16233 length:1689 start_codon:yes stop_codon:yes gene_type:complete